MDAKIFGKFIAMCRKRIGLTQADLAVKLNVTDKAVSRWERGVGFPDISTIEPLASALEMSVLEIMKSKCENENASVTKPNGFCIQGNYFWPHPVYIKDNALKKFPDFMQEHVKNGGKLYVITEPENDKVLISMSEENYGNTVSVNTADVIIKLAKKVKPNVLAVMPKEMEKYRRSGGDTYMIGYPKDGKCVIATGMTSESFSITVNYYEWAEYEFAEYEKPDYSEIAATMAKCIRQIRKNQDELGRRASIRLRNYLIHCTTLEELNNLTAIYRNNKSNLIIGYDPKRVAKFVGEMLKKYPKTDDVVERHLEHRNHIYAEIGAIMQDCLDVVHNSKDTGEINKGYQLLHMYLEDCLKRGGMDYLTVIYKNNTDDSEIGYELESVIEFVNMLVEEYPLPKV